MRKIFCDLCGKEITVIYSELNATFLDEENKYPSDLDRALEIRVVMPVKELVYDNVYNDCKVEKTYELFSVEEMCVECARKLKTKIISTIEEFLQGVDKNEKDTHII